MSSANTATEFFWLGALTVLLTGLWPRPSRLRPRI